MGEGKKSFWEQVAIILGAVTAMLVAVTGLMVTYRTLSTADISNASAIKNEVIRPAAASGSAPTLGDHSESRPQRSVVPQPPQDRGVDRPAVAQVSVVVTPVEPSRTGCERESMLRSPDEPTNPVLITFSNRSDHPIWVYWINSRGDRVRGTQPGRRFGLLEPGQESRMRSFEDHVWVLADQQSLCRRVVIVGDEDSTYVYR